MKNKIKNTFKKAGIATLAFTTGLVVFLGALSVYATWDTEKTSSDQLTSLDWNNMVKQVKSWTRTTGLDATYGTDDDVVYLTSGNVGIGTNDPTAKLEVDGNIKTSEGITVGNSTSTEAGTIRWNGTTFEGYDGTAWAGLGGGDGESSVWSENGTNIFYNAGNVGIGTDTPTHTLDLATAVGTNAELNINSGSAANNWGMYHDGTSGELKFWDSAGTGDKNILSLKSEGTMRMQTLSAEPYACEVAEKGSIAVTLGTPICVCDGADWVSFADNSVPCDWDGSGSVRVFNCETDGGGKPANSEWNIVSSYAQKCTSFSEDTCTTWSPADSTADYSLSSSSTACNFKCADGYTWDGSICSLLPAGYITIDNCIELQAIGQDAAWITSKCGADCSASAYPLNGKYFVTRDIDCIATDYTKPLTFNASVWTSTGFQPIAPLVGDIFKGTFEGNNKKISNLYINNNTGINVGLFANIGTNTAKVMNIELVNVYIKGGSYRTGGLVGSNGASGLISRTSVTGNVIGGEYTGGLIGINSFGGIIEYSHASCSVSGGKYTGGFVGYNDILSLITYSSATGNVNGGQNTGGFVGYNNNDIKYSYSTGDTNGGGTDVGGFVGFNSNDGDIYNSYSTGDAQGTDYDVGGFVGENNGGRIYYAYSTGDARGNGRVGGFAGQQVSGVIMHAYTLGKAMKCSTCLSGSSIYGFVGGPNAGGTFVRCFVNSTITGATTVGMCGGTVCTASKVALATTSAMQSDATPTSNQIATYNSWNWTTTEDGWKLDSIDNTATKYFPCLNWQDNSTCLVTP